MKDDYLWDKTGEDAEIQGFEKALQAFRYQETAPPELPQKVFALEKPKPRRRFQFAFGMAAFASLVLVLSIAWLQFGGDKTPALETIATAPAPQREEIDGASLSAPREISPAVKTIEKTAATVKPNVVKARRGTALLVRPEKAVWRTKRTKAPVETLTAEEKYAYDQLMLALSITGSKLKIVKDKIAGTEDQNAVREAAK